jgi:hypothetical protein
MYKISLAFVLYAILSLLIRATLIKKKLRLREDNSESTADSAEDGVEDNKDKNAQCKIFWLKLIFNLVIEYAKGVINLLNNDPEVSLNVIRQLLLKVKVEEFEADEKTKIYDFAINDYSHSSAKASLDLNKKSNNYVANLTIQGIYLKVTGRFHQKNPWYMPDIKADFIIFINDLDINATLEFTKDLLVVPGGSKFKYLQEPKLKIELSKSGYGKLVEFFAEKIVTWKKGKLIKELDEAANKMLDKKDLIKNQIKKIISQNS